MKRLKKLLASALLVCMLVSMLPVGALADDGCAHSMVSATCTTAAYCSICGASDGVIPGHSMVPATCATAAYCSVCGASDGIIPGHSMVPATCTTAAYCSVCLVTNGDALGHSFNEATCTVGQTCSRCGANGNAALGHNYTGTVTTAATCVAAGVMTYTCSRCGGSYTEAISATGHTPGTVTATTDPTCTAAGSKTVNCTACNVPYTVSVPALGHSFSEATCTVGQTCSRCGANGNAALGHNYTGTVTTAATCTEAGVMSYTCSACGDSYTETIAALGHNYADATCTAPKTCANCDLTEGEPLGHTAGGETVITAPTCTEDGVKSVKCTVCGDSYNEAIPALGHSYEKAVTTEATCTEKGVKTFSCTVDGCEDSYTEDIEALGHEYLNATCTAPKTCGRCEATEGEALGHNYENGMCSVCYALCAHSGGEASCTELAVCEICGLSYGELGHVGGAASCEALAVCESCGQPYGDYAHSGGEATCTGRAICDSCGQAYGEPLGHDYNEQHLCERCGEKEQPLKSIRKNSSKLTITGGEKTVHVGKTLGLSVQGLDDASAAVTWSSKPASVATVATDGTVTGVAKGTATITAEAGGKTATTEITVEDHVYDDWDRDMTGHWPLCSCGEKSDFGAHTLAWVNDKGRFVCNVCGYESEVQGEPVIFSDIAADQSIPVGREFTMQLLNVPLSVVTTATWTSNNESVVDYVGSLEFGNTFKALAAGTATITAAYAGGSVSRTVTVVEESIPATNITLTAPTTVYVGNSFNVTYTLEPANSTDTVAWTISDTEKATPSLPIDKGMSFMARQGGTVTITATANEQVNATATIEILEKRITIADGDVELENDETRQLSATIEPNDGTKIAWSSDNPEIATVDENTGLVTGKAKGTATITARALDNSGASDSVKVYVYENDVGYITAEKDGIDVGESVKLRLVHPGVEDNANVRWSVYPSDALAIVGNGSNATVTGMLAGIGETITISAVYDSVKVTYANMTVYAPTITVTGDDSLYVGKTAQLTATVSPKYKDGITITWTSGDPKIATVDKNGVVKGLAKGDVMITATVSDNTAIAGSKQITVNPAPITGISVSGPNSVVTGKTITLKADITPDNASNKSVTWTSSDTSIATVDKNTGVVKGVKADPKPVTITAIADADNSVYAKHFVKVISPVYLYYGNGTYFNGIHPMPFVSSDAWNGSYPVKVLINGIPLVHGRDYSFYSSPSGMTGVTVHPGILRVLPQNAWHLIEIHSANGVAAGHFATGYFGYYNVYGVKTGDDSAPGLWAMLCLLGISGAGIILVKSRKRKA